MNKDITSTKLTAMTGKAIVEFIRKSETTVSN
jgi:DNA-directed RNA polymerase subunit H (RpoH/RPB5)